MSSSELPGTAEVERAYRAAHRALEEILPPGSYVPEKDLGTSGVISQLWSVVRMAEAAALAQFGPQVSWEGPDGREFGLAIGCVDLDAGTRGSGPVRVG